MNKNIHSYLSDASCTKRWSATGVRPGPQGRQLSDDNENILCPSQNISVIQATHRIYRINDESCGTNSKNSLGSRSSVMPDASCCRFVSGTLKCANRMCLTMPVAVLQPVYAQSGHLQRNGGTFWWVAS